MQQHELAALLLAAKLTPAEEANLESMHGDLDASVIGCEGSTMPPTTTVREFAEWQKLMKQAVTGVDEEEMEELRRHDILASRDWLRYLFKQHIPFTQGFQTWWLGEKSQFYIERGDDKLYIPAELVVARDSTKIIAGFHQAFTPEPS